MRQAPLALMGALVVIAGAILLPAPARALEVGDPIPKPSATLKNVDGHKLTLADVAGPHGTLVIFSCNACPWVRAWEERIVAVGNTYRKRGFGVIAINSNDPTVVEGDGFEQMKQRAREEDFEFPYVVDAGSELARAFGATRTPEVFLFGPAGKLAYHGTIDDRPQRSDSVSEHYLRDALDAILAGHDVAVKETKAVGCPIRFGPEPVPPPIASRQRKAEATSANGG